VPTVSRRLVRFSTGAGIAGRYGRSVSAARGRRSISRRKRWRALHRAGCSSRTGCGGSSSPLRRWIGRSWTTAP